jgi:TonB-dependent receptor
VDFDWGNVVFGGRVETLTNSGTAVVNNRILDTSRETTLFYPSLHVNYDVTDQWKLRLGATSTASRPDLGVARPNFSVNDTALSVSGGNPDAEPEKQIGLDAYVEFYPQGDGFFSAGLFYKDISDVLFTEITSFGAENSAAFNSIPGVTQIDRSGYAFTRTGNAGDGSLLGFEIYYSNTAQSLVDTYELPQWLGGFGIRASGTFIDSEVNIPAVRNLAGVITQPGRTQRLQGSSDATYNFQLTYEKYDLSVRLAYQYRTDWVQGYGTYTTVAGQVVPSGNGDTFWDNDDELDLSVRYQFSDALEVYFDGVNLTDSGARRFVDSSLFPIEYEEFGRRYIAGLRFNF